MLRRTSINSSWIDSHQKKIDERRYRAFFGGLALCKPQTNLANLQKHLLGVLIKKRQSSRIVELEGGAGELALMGVGTGELAMESYDDAYRQLVAERNQIDQLAQELSGNCEIEDTTGLKELLKIMTPQEVEMIGYAGRFPDVSVRKRLGEYLSGLLRSSKESAEAIIKSTHPYLVTFYNFMKICISLLSVAEGLTKYGSYILAIYAYFSVYYSQVLSPENITNVIAETSYMMTNFLVDETGTQFSGATMFLGMLGCGLVHILSAGFLLNSLKQEFFDGMDRRPFVNKRRVLIKALTLTGWTGLVVHDILAVTGKSISVFDTIILNPTQTWESKIMHSQLVSSALIQAVTTWNYLFVGVSGTYVTVPNDILAESDAAKSSYLNAGRKLIQGLFQWATGKEAERSIFVIEKTNPYAPLALLTEFVKISTDFAKGVLEGVNDVSTFKVGTTQINNWAAAYGLILFHGLLFKLPKIVSYPTRLASRAIAARADRIEELIDAQRRAIMASQSQDIGNQLTAMGVSPEPERGRSLTRMDEMPRRRSVSRTRARSPSRGRSMMDGPVSR